jgi:hypothetical protein
VVCRLASRSAATSSYTNDTVPYLPTSGWYPATAGATATGVGESSRSLRTLSSGSTTNVFSPGMIAAATVGSIGAALALLAILFFFVRRRRARTHVVAVGTDTYRRYLDLESQVRALQEQVDGLVGQQVVYAGRSMSYTNEKEAEAFGKDGDGKAKEALPTYLD